MADGKEAIAEKRDQSPNIESKIYLQTEKARIAKLSISELIVDLNTHISTVTGALDKFAKKILSSPYKPPEVLLSEPVKIEFKDGFKGTLSYNKWQQELEDANKRLQTLQKMEQGEILSTEEYDFLLQQEVLNDNDAVKNYPKVVGRSSCIVM